MPILASTTYVNAYGKSSLIAVASNLQSMQGFADIYVVKYSTLGKALWSARIASPQGDENGFGIATDSSGNVYVTGQISFGGIITAYSSNGVPFGSLQPSAGSNDVFVVKYNTTGTVQWIARVGSTSADVGYAIATDSSGNVYVTGSGGSATVTAYSSNGVAFGSTLGNAGGGDAFVVKYNTSGIVQWVASIASTQADVGYGIATDSSGNVYVTGQGGSGAAITVYSSSGSAFGTTLANLGGTDVFIVKYNTSGIAQWVARLGSSSSELGYAIATDSSGNVYVTGQNATTDADFTAYSSNGVAFGTILPPEGSGDAFIVKYNTNGIVQWVAKTGSTSADIGYAIATDSSRNVYVTGQGGGAIKAYSSNGVAFGTTISNIASTDVFIVKYNTSGIVQWVANIASIQGDIGYGIATDSSGNVYVTGMGGSNVSVTAFDCNNGSAFVPALANSGNQDAFVVKYNTNGIVQWVTRIASTGLDMGRAICVDSGGNAYTTGQFTGYSTYIYGQSLGLFSTLPNSGGTDAFVVKYNTSGAPQWVGRIASTGDDIGYAIAADTSGNVYVTGQGGSGVVVTAYSSDGVAFGTTLSNDGGNDAFVVKYDTSGIVQWVARVAGTAGDIGYAIATDSSGNVYVTGSYGTVTAYSSNGVAFGTTLANAGSNDVFIVKYDTSGIVQWVARIASTASDIGYAIATDTSGNVYVTGQGGAAVVTAYSSNGVAFGTTLANAGGADAFVVKYDTSGIVQWVARVASTASDIGYGIATDSSGNLYVTGQGGLNATVTAYSSNGVAFGTTLPNSGGTDAFIVKYNTGGIVQWVARVASSQSDIGYGIATDSSGNVYVTGQGGGATVSVFSSDGVAFGTLTNVGTGDVFVVKYNTNGIVQWVTKIASTSADIGYGIATDSSGNVYIHANTSSLTTTFTAFNQNQEIFARSYGSGGLFKYNSDGFGQWAQIVRGTTGVTNNRAVTLDGLNNVYISGATTSGQPMQIYNADNTIYLLLNATGGRQDCFIVKYASNTTPQWVARIASTSDDFGYGIATDSSGNVYVTGQYGSGATVTAFSSNGVAFGTTLANSGSTDAFIVKYDTSGIVQWVARIGSAEDESGFGIATDSSGNVYVTGYYGFNSTASVFNSSGVAQATLPTSSGVDAFIVKYTTDGNVVWRARISSSSYDYGHAIATDSSGNVYVTGRGNGVVTAYSSNGSAFSPGLLNSGNDDAFVVKYNTNGIVQWAARIASDGQDVGYAIDTDSSGNVYVAGSYQIVTGGNTVSVFGYDGVAFGTKLSPIGQTDVFVVKYTTDGIVVWVAKIGSNAFDFGYAIATDSSGNVYVTGQGGNGTITAYSSNGVDFGSTLANFGNGDAFVVKYDTFGYVQWVARIASTSGDVGYGITTDSSGNVYVTGSGGTTTSVFNSNGTLFGSAGVFSLTESFIVKYDTNGNAQWLSVMPTSSTSMSARAISLDVSGNIYTTGTVSTTPLVPFSA